jgi:hypothetical protein
MNSLEDAIFQDRRNDVMEAIAAEDQDSTTKEICNFRREDGVAERNDVLTNPAVRNSRSWVNNISDWPTLAQCSRNLGIEVRDSSVGVSILLSTCVLPSTTIVDVVLNWN